MRYDRTKVITALSPLTFPRSLSASLSTAVVSFLIALIVPAGTTWAAAGTDHASCPNSASPGFRTYLPDCRAYELVTPPYKEAQPAGTDGVSEELGESGPRLLIRDFGSFSGVEDQTGLGALYEVQRAGPEAWRSTPFDAPFSTFPLFAVETMSSDFTHSLWVARTPGHSEREDLYLRNPEGVFTPIGPAQPPLMNERVTIFAGASEDLSDIVLQAFGPRVWPGDTTTSQASSLYEYVGTNNSEPQLVGVSDNGPVAKVEESHLISSCGTYLGSPNGDSYNSVSQDGSTIFFTALACGGTPPVNELFARVDNGHQDAHTVAISEPSSADCQTCNTSGPAEALFRGASLDGTKVFFMTEQQLLPAATGLGPYLYEYDFGAPAGRRVTLVSAGDVAGARVQGVARISEDGSHAYFVAQGVLTGEPNAEGEHAEENSKNLYVSIRECPDDGTNCVEPTQRTSFIGRLSEKDEEDWAGSDIRPVQATPDGRFLVFQSTADLTADEEERPEAGQIFEYNSDTGHLARVSRGTNGYNQNGNSDIFQARIPTQGYYEHDYPTLRFQDLAISADGSYVFFTSEDGLTPFALTGYRNVYEYHEGTVALISGGHDLAIVEREPGVELFGTDASGRDVFFATVEPLVPQDTDTQQDFYDARIDGGSRPSIIRTQCVGDPCQGTASGRLPLPSLATSSIPPEAGGVTIAPTGGKAKTTVKKTKAKAKKRRRGKRRGKHRAKPAKRRG
jgi:hypothetical protein